MPFEWLSVPAIINELLSIAKTGSAWLPHRPKIAVSARWKYEGEKRRYSFDVEISNQEHHPATVDAIAILEPAGGMLRNDPSVLSWIIEGGRIDARESGLGPAKLALNVDLEIAAKQNGNFSFVFVPPGDWHGSRLIAELRIVVHGPNETHRRVKIRRQLSPRPPNNEMLQEGPSQSAESLSVAQAIDRFCDPELIDSRNERRQELDSARSDYGAAEQRSKQIQAVFGWARQTSLQIEFEALQAECVFATLMANGLSQSLVNIEAELVELLLGGIASGQLIARGYAEPHKAGGDEVVVPAREWRILSLTDTGFATRKGTQVPVYSDVQIAQSRKGESVRLISRRKLAPIIGILLKPGMQPYIAMDRQGERMLSTARIGILNFGPPPLSNCKVFIEDIAPVAPIPGGTPILLSGDGFMLRPDDPDKLIDIASHWDHVDKYRFSAPFAGAFAETLSYIDDKEQRTFTLQIHATECHRSAKFRIGTDPSKAVHLEFLGYLD